MNPKYVKSRYLCMYIPACIWTETVLTSIAPWFTSSSKCLTLAHRLSRRTGVPPVLSSWHWRTKQHHLARIYLIFFIDLHTSQAWRNEFRGGSTRLHWGPPEKGSQTFRRAHNVSICLNNGIKAVNRAHFSTYHVPSGLSEEINFCWPIGGFRRYLDHDPPPPKVNPRPAGPLDFPPPAGGGGVWTPPHDRLLVAVEKNERQHSKAHEK